MGVFHGNECNFATLLTLSSLLLVIGFATNTSAVSQRPKTAGDLLLDLATSGLISLFNSTNNDDDRAVAKGSADFCSRQENFESLMKQRVRCDDIFKNKCCEVRDECRTKPLCKDPEYLQDKVLCCMLLPELDPTREDNSFKLVKCVVESLKKILTGESKIPSVCCEISGLKPFCDVKMTPVVAKKERKSKGGNGYKCMDGFETKCMCLEKRDGWKSFCPPKGDTTTSAPGGGGERKSMSRLIREDDE